MEEGYTIVPGAFPHEVSSAWIADANRRIAEEPERWVKRYDPDDPNRSLKSYRSDDPTTWTWDRLDLIGSETFDIAEIAPLMWSALSDVLGGPARIDTTVMSNYMIPNFRSDVPHFRPPSPTENWHVDDPSGINSLYGVRNGLVIVAMYSDVEPEGGGTFIAPGSHRVVASALAEDTDVDLTAPAVRRELYEKSVGSKPAFELTGRCGDVALLHPFLLHTSSRNLSGRIRWMANPLIYTRTPLDFERSDEACLSLVERSVRHAVSNLDRPQP